MGMSYQATLLILLVFLSVSYTSNSFPSNCRRCKFYVRASVGGAPVAPPDTSSSGKKPNVGLIVGLTLLLVFILVAAFVCIYWMRRFTSEGSMRQARVLVQPGVVRQQVPPQQRVVRPGIRRDEKREAQKQGVVQLQDYQQPPRDVRVAEKNKRGEQGNGEVAEENKRDEQRKQLLKQQRLQDVGVDERMKGRRREKQQVPLPPPPPPLPTWDVGVDEEMKGRRKGKEHVPLPPPPPPLPTWDVGVDEQMKGRRKGKEHVPPPPPPPLPTWDVGVDERMKARRKGKEHVPPPPPPPPPPLPIWDVGVDEQMKGRRKGKEHVPLPPPPPPLPTWDEGVDEQMKGRRRERQQVPPPPPPVPLPTWDVGVDEKTKGRRKGKEHVKETENSLGLPNKYSYNYIKSATKNFDPNLKIGGGGFGIVYLGTLHDGTMVAVKTLKYGGQIDDFKNEVEALVQADHPNLVKLIGYCDDSITRFLVYEYMRNSSLDKWIFHAIPGQTLSWPEMKNIIQGIAQGLVYLHEESDKTILHRDLKPHNVLLDDNKNVKLCDFGLAKLINKDQSSTSTTFAGTPGYMAPEVLKHRKITEKIDVYSFGVVVLEVMFGRRYLQLVSADENTGTEEIKLPDLIRKLSVEMQKYGREIYMMGRLAVLCLRTKPEERPSMSVMLASIRSLNAKARRN